MPNPTLTALIIFASVAIPILAAATTAVAPHVRRLLVVKLEEQELRRLHAALKGASSVVSAVAKVTDGFTLDDGIARVLELATAEVGKAVIEKHRKTAIAMIAAIHTDRRRPDIDLGPATDVKSIPSVIRTAGDSPPKR